jgi:hypothetical protein
MIVADGYMMGHLLYKVLLSLSAFQHFSKPETDWLRAAWRSLAAC